MPFWKKKCESFDKTARPTQYDETKWPGLDVKRLILETDGFIVFIDNDTDVDWRTTNQYDEGAKVESGDLNDILNRAAILECIPNDQHGETIRMNFKRMIGEGVARALDNDHQNATKILDKAESYITDRNIETARFWQLTTSTICGVCFALIGVCLWSLRNLLFPVWGETAFFLLFSAVAGAVGANLSFIFRIGNAKITSEAIRRLHILEALSRIFGGAISGVAISLLVNLGILVPLFKNVGNMPLAMLGAGLIAGASERWVPSLIVKIENSAETAKEKV